MYCAFCYHAEAEEPDPEPVDGLLEEYEEGFESEKALERLTRKDFGRYA